MNNPVAGCKYLLDGFALIFKPGLRRFVIIPVMINILLFTGLFFLLRHYTGEFNLWLTHHLPSWLRWFAEIVWLLFFISFVIIFIYTFVTIGNIVSAPFNSFLAENIEFHLTGVRPNERSLMDNIKDVPRIVGRQLGIIGYYLPRALGILLLFLIPAFQPFAAVIWFVFHAWVMTLTYIDYPTDNHRISMRDARTMLWQNRWLALGFGISVLISAMIPILNFFTIPAAVAGATSLWVNEFARTKLITGEP